MDSILEEIHDRVEVGKAEIKATTEKINAYQCLLDFQEKTVNDLETARRVLETIDSQLSIKTTIALGEDRDH